MAGIGDFLQGVVQGFPAAARNASQFELSARKIQAQQQNADTAKQAQALNKKKFELDQSQQEFQNMMNVMKLPKVQRSPFVNNLVKAGRITEAAGKTILAADDNIIDVFGNAIADGSVDPVELGTLMRHADYDTIAKRLGDFMGQVKLQDEAKQQALTEGRTKALLQGGVSAQARPQAQEQERALQVPSLTQGFSGGLPRQGQVAASPQGQPQAAPGLPDVNTMTLEELTAELSSQGKSQSELDRLIKKDRQEEAMISKLLPQTGATAKNKISAFQANRRLNQAKINSIKRSMDKGFSPTISKALADSRAALDQLGRIKKLFNPDFTGPIDSFKVGIGRFKLPKGAKETAFRSEVALLKVQMRKAFFGASQTKIELAGSTDAIPAVELNDVEFESAMKTVERNLTSQITRLEEAGTESRFSVSQDRGRGF